MVLGPQCYLCGHVFHPTQHQISKQVIRCEFCRKLILIDNCDIQDDWY